MVVRAEAETLTSVSTTVSSLFAAVGGPAVLTRRGVDRTRCRLIAGTIHGNEPSGARAIVHVLSQPAPPATDLILVLGAVNAALAEPLFSRRMLPGRRDLNRCFRGPFEQRDDDDNGPVARGILDAVSDARAGRTLEAAVDIHNTTGDNPDFVITSATDDAHAGLASLFSRRVLAWRLQLGTFAEVLDEQCCAVTFEAGRAHDEAADARARDAAWRFASLERLPTTGRADTVHRDPVRVRLAPGLSVAFGAPTTNGVDVDVTLDARIDRHNFVVVPAGTVLGAVRAGAPWPLVADGDDRRDGPDLSRGLFAVEAGALTTRVPLVPLMMTTNAAVAASDCLFYCCPHP